MNISYPMIGKVCSDNDVLSETKGLEAILQQIDLREREVSPQSQEWGDYFLRLCMSRKVVSIQAGHRLATTEKNLWQVMVEDWVSAFLRGVDFERQRRGHPLIIESEAGIDPEATGTAASQRVMRVVFLLLRRCPPVENKVFNASDKRIILSDLHLASMFGGLWIDGYVAGVSCERKRLNTENPNDNLPTGTGRGTVEGGDCRLGPL